MSGQRRDCRCKTVRHEHGTKLAYVRDLCRCDECRAAATAYEARLRKSHAYGRFNGLIDADPARQHVWALMDAGIGLKQITKLGGPSGGVLCKLMYGQSRGDGTRRPPSRRITPRVAERIFAISPSLDVLAPHRLVGAVGTRRRLQALIAIGWCGSQLGRRIGVSPTNFGRLLTVEQVEARTARAVRDLFNDLWDTPPSHETHREKIAYARALRRARENHWLPPLAWDDIDNDPEPASVTDLRAFDEIAVERYIAGTLRHRAAQSYPPELLEAVRRMHACGLSDRAIGERIGLSPDAVSQLRRRKLAGAA